jgi:type II secretory pathway pseudopilin PulG
MNKKRKKGFTLVEIIIYFGLVSIILILIIGFSLNIFESTNKNNVYREIQQNGRFIMQKIDSAIKSASELNHPSSLGESSDYLSLATQNSETDPIIIELSSEDIFITKGEQDSYQLNSSQTKITNLEFLNISYPDNPGTIKTSLTISYNNISEKNEYQASLDFSLTTNLRPGGAGGEEEPGGGPGVADYCDGQATLCEDFTNANQCEKQQNCSWVDKNCQGTVIDCIEFENEADCEAQKGCSWITP